MLNYCCYRSLHELNNQMALLSRTTNMESLISKLYFAKGLILVILKLVNFPTQDWCGIFNIFEWSFGVLIWVIPY